MAKVNYQRTHSANVCVCVVIAADEAESRVQQICVQESLAPPFLFYTQDQSTQIQKHTKHIHITASLKSSWTLSCYTQ